MKLIKSIDIDVSLQNELLSKAEENRQVSLCLEDAMRETNELKSQVSQSLFNETAWNHKDTKLKIAAQCAYLYMLVMWWEWN